MPKKKRSKTGSMDQFNISYEYFNRDIALVNDTYLVSWRTMDALLDMLDRVREEHDAALEIYGDEDVLYRHIRNLKDLEDYE